MPIELEHLLNRGFRIIYEDRNIVILEHNNNLEPMACWSTASKTVRNAAPEEIEKAMAQK